MKAWFNKQPKLLQVILLFIPVVNWVIEAFIRWPLFLKKKGLINLVMAIIATVPTGIAIGWLDVIWTLLFGHLFLAK